MNEINMTPLVDVMLVLLIIFIIHRAGDETFGQRNYSAPMSDNPAQCKTCRI